LETPALLKTNILIVVDTNMVMAEYRHPSMKFNKPTLINDKGIFLLSSLKRGSALKPETGIAKATGKLTFVAFRGTSIEENADSAIIIYKVNGQKENSTLGKFTVQKKTIDMAVMPDNTTPNGLPAIYGNINFTSITSRMPIGIQKITISFALYTLDDDKETQKLYGYYCFNTDITIGA